MTIKVLNIRWKSGGVSSHEYAPNKPKASSKLHQKTYCHQKRDKRSCFIAHRLVLSLQSVHQAAAAADGHEGDPEELCGLPEAEELAVVEALHQGTVCVGVGVCGDRPVCEFTGLPALLASYFFIIVDLNQLAS